MYTSGGNLGHVTWIIYININFTFTGRLHIKFGFDWPNGFRGDCYLSLWLHATNFKIVTDEALVAETAVWPNLFLFNMIIALKGFFFIQKSIVLLDLLLLFSDTTIYP